MLWLKSCPRCHHGDLVLGSDLWGWYRQCLQCSYLEDLPTYLLRKRPFVNSEPISNTSERMVNS